MVNQMSTTSQSQSRKRGPHFKVSRAQAEQIKIAYENSPDSLDEIARKSGVTKQTIYNVIKRLRDEKSGRKTEGWQ